jgi:hypothetical protein
MVAQWSRFSLSPPLFTAPSLCTYCLMSCDNANEHYYRTMVRNDRAPIYLNFSYILPIETIKRTISQVYTTICNQPLHATVYQTSLQASRQSAFGHLAHPTSQHHIRISILRSWSTQDVYLPGLGRHAGRFPPLRRCAYDHGKPSPIWHAKQLASRKFRCGLSLQECPLHDRPDEPMARRLHTETPI